MLQGKRMLRISEFLRLFFSNFLILKLVKQPELNIPKKFTTFGTRKSRLQQFVTNKNINLFC